MLILHIRTWESIPSLWGFVYGMEHWFYHPLQILAFSWRLGLLPSMVEGTQRPQNQCISDWIDGLHMLPILLNSPSDLHYHEPRHLNLFFPITMFCQFYFLRVFWTTIVPREIAKAQCAICPSWNHIVIITNTYWALILLSLSKN